MNKHPNLSSPPLHLPTDHKAVLAQYREPSMGRCVWQLLSSLVPFCLLWALMFFSLQYSYWLTLTLSIPTAGFMVRMFILQHDCGHGSFFKSKQLNDLIGTVLGVLVLTPYQCWRREHALHHASSGDLDRRGYGDVDMLTVNEYLKLTPLKRLTYRLYRNPFVLFGIAPIVYFAILRRFTFDIDPSWKNERASVHYTNLALLISFLVAGWLVGFQQFLMVHLPVTILASSLGVWMFYVQHTFEETYWEHHDNWDFEVAAMSGSSYYHLPRGLQWMTANIGFHHIHHLDSRIPNYRLQECFDGNSQFQKVNHLTIRQSLACISFKLWDENTGKMVGFKNLEGKGGAL